MLNEFNYISLIKCIEFIHKSLALDMKMSKVFARAEAVEMALIKAKTGEEDIINAIKDQVQEENEKKALDKLYEFRMHFKCFAFS